MGSKVKENLLKKTAQNFYGLIKKALVLSFMLLLYVPAFSQDSNPLSEIISEYRDGRITVNEAVLNQITLLNSHLHEEASKIKCAFPLSSMMHNHKDHLSEEVHAKYQNDFSISNSLVTENFISASENFIVYYETTGNNAVPLGDLNGNSVPDYVEWVAEAAELSYEYEVNTLGFPDFIPNGSQYRIQILNSGAYGFTEQNSESPGGTTIGIENDFSGFPSNDDPEGDQKGAIKVTMAHEIKHAIQYIQNGWSGDANQWLEMDATLYEEVVYDDVNDYYNYLDSFGDNFFGAPSRSLIPGSYEDITWALFFVERFDNAFWQKTWNTINNGSTSDFLGAIDATLADYNVSFEEAVAENFLWHYASGFNNSSTLYGFDERALYPNPNTDEQFDGIQLSLSGEERIRPFSGRYYEYDITQETTNLIRLDILASTSDIQAGIIAYYDDTSIQTALITEPTSNELTINETDISFEGLERIGLVLFNSNSVTTQTAQFQLHDYAPTGATEIQLSQNYPNPFNPSTTILIDVPFSQNVKLTVFDYLGRQVQVLQDGILPSGQATVQFNGDNLASGIYFYQLENSEGILVKKMTLIK